MYPRKHIWCIVHHVFIKLSHKRVRNNNMYLYIINNSLIFFVLTNELVIYQTHNVLIIYMNCTLAVVIYTPMAVMKQVVKRRQH